MDAVPVMGEGDDSLLALVDFKWLMAGLGWRIDLTRLCRDAGYLGDCARLGLSSESSLLRRCSAELLRRHPAAQACGA
ncbi:hypothetical protein [Azohydromonas caseinilytica]|uniref:Uncharacterized protein n=1 Tax=Azohydromonas caseinilytica TaxID=2728836 RepID=A0A848FFY2_9BURK|nr:hypothetical protein [Azohydromonas caseinilytica]NML18056.1 hypothetical protein [Azohydromonas caseinilytica]